MLLGALIILTWFLMSYPAACFAGRFIAAGSRECETQEPGENDQRQGAKQILVDSVHGVTTP